MKNNHSQENEKCGQKNALFFQIFSNKSVKLRIPPKNQINYVYQKLKRFSQNKNKKIPSQFILLYFVRQLLKYP